MKKSKKKAIIIIIALVLVLAAAVTAIVLLTKDTAEEEELTATVVNISEKRNTLEYLIVKWNSDNKEHIGEGETKPCCVTVGDVTTYYDTFEEGWIAANTTEKNKDETIFVLFADWVADENGSFGTGDCFINGSGGLLIKGWTTKFTIDFNGYKIDRNLTGDSVKNGSVIKIDESKNVHFENGYITGGANTDDGAGVLIYGTSNVYFDNMIVTGNISGNNGGGIYVGSHAAIYLNDTRVEGNYAENYGAGVFCDFKAGNGGKYKIQKLSGVVKIRNNMASNGNNNLVLNSIFKDGISACIKSAELSEDSAIYLSVRYNDSLEKPVLLKNETNSQSFQYFHVDSKDYKFVSSLPVGNDYFYGIKG